MNLSNARPGQRKAFDVCVNKINNGVKAISIVLPTRYGKSDLMRLLAYHLKYDTGQIHGAIAFSPAENLSSQLVDIKKVKAMIKRYDLDNHLTTNVLRLKTAYVSDLFSNNEYFMSANIQLATSQESQFKELQKSILHRTGKPLLLFIDECHETSEQKRRGEFVKWMLDAGSTIIMLTATPIRSDNEIIPGFNVEIIDEKDARRFVVCDFGDGIHNKVDAYKGVKQLIRLTPDHETSFREAWEEEPSPLCKLTREIVDVLISELGDETTKKLSEIPPSQARLYLSKAIRNKSVVDRAIDLFLSNMRDLKRKNNELAGIIFTGNDVSSDNLDNAHANQIAKTIKRKQANFNLDLSVKIATMKTEEDEKSAKIIESFANGHGDVLIVKQMGGAGLDAPRIKCCLDLSSIRTVASVVQRVMRCATPIPKLNVGVVITLDDQLMSAIWKKEITEAGGEASGSWRDANMELVDSYLKEKGDDRDHNLFCIDNAFLSGYDDNNGKTGSMNYRDAVDYLVEKFPSISAHHTKPEIEIICRGLLSLNESKHDHGDHSLNDQINDLREEINNKARDFANMHSKYTGNGENSEWVKRFKTAINKAKGAAGVELCTELQHITNKFSLQKMSDYLDSMRCQ